MTDDLLTRPEASAAVDGAGWRVLLGSYAAAIAVTSLARAVEVAQLAAAVSDEVDIDLRSDRVELVLRARTRAGADAARAITAALRSAGFELLPPTGVPRPVQRLELAVDTMDRERIRPFWAAVLALDPGKDGNELVDPAGQLPSLWFQQLDEPRPQRNRIHLDITVAHDEAESRVAAALAAGGVLVSDEAARSFWILADCEGNEVCVCTWQDRD